MERQWSGTDTIEFHILAQIPLLLFISFISSKKESIYTTVNTHTISEHKYSI